jgi:hypothetical protein
MLFVMFVNTLPVVTVIVLVVAVFVALLSDIEVTTVDEGWEAATVSWLTVGASKFEGTIAPAGSQKPVPALNEAVYPGSQQNKLGDEYMIQDEFAQTGKLVMASRQSASIY